jgi:hypothetical protein
MLMKRDTILVRWGEMVEMAAEAGLSLRTVKALLRAKKIKRRIPRVKSRGVKTPRAFYLREDVELAFKNVIDMG